MINKIKQSIRVLFPKKVSEKDIFEYTIKRNPQIKSFEVLDDIYQLTLKNNQNIFVRDFKYSDYQVFKQIFIQKEYDVVLKMFSLNKFKNEKPIIIDAGANVGYTSFFFLSNLNNAKIFAVEPSVENCEMIKKNISGFSKNVKIYQNALSEKENTSFNLDRGFRDGKDWSITTEEVRNGIVKGISINEIITENSLEYISLLKIDIEGAERFIFKVENDLPFLKITQIIAIEIHDEYKIRATINEILIKNNFFIFESGELTIGINKDFL